MTVAPAVAVALLVAAFPWPEVTPGNTPEERSADRAARLGAAERLGQLHSGEGDERLRPLLDDLDPTVRLTAARALAVRQDPLALAAAVRWVLSGNAADRNAGFEALRAARALTPEARAALERALADGDPAVRLSALEVLAGTNIDPRPSLAAVAGTLEDSAAAVRLEALHLLGDTRDPRAALSVLARIGDADRAVRREAIATLGALRDTRVVPPLLRLLDAPADELRRAAIEALAGLQAPAAVAPLATLGRRRPADQVARQAQWALGEIATPEAVAILVELLREPPVTDEARAALLRAGARAVPALVRELESDGGAVAEAAALLGRLGDRRAVPALLEALQRRDLSLPAILRALAALAPSEAVAAVVPLAADPAREIRRLALEVLLAIGDDRAVVVLAGALADGDAPVRRTAAALAGVLRAHAATAAVAARLADDDGGVREEAVRALGRLGGVTACRALVKAARAQAAPPGALAEALAAVARHDCLDAALSAGEGAPAGAHWPLVEAVAAGLRDGERAPGAAVELLLAATSDEERVAVAAADGLTGRSGGGDLAEAFERAAAPVRARLCPALAGTAAGRSLLAARLGDRREDPEVRAAAAWSLAGSNEGRAALERARTDLHPAVAANASAALKPHASRAALALRLAGDARALPHAWLRVEVPGVGPVWTRSDVLGRVRLLGLPDASYTVTPADPGLVLGGVAQPQN